MSVGALLWAMVVPIKRLEAAKSRLAVDPDLRADLALAMALDTVRAALSCPAVEVVVVVTDDARAAKETAASGAIVVPDEPDAGLNPALMHGATTALADAPLAGLSCVAALSSDLPALLADELAAVLTAAAATRSAVVSDAAGTGTTLFAATAPEHFAPVFGPNSRAAHVARGATDLTDQSGGSVRCDVDVLADLAAAARIGLGEETRRVVELSGLELG